MKSLFFRFTHLLLFLISAQFLLAQPTPNDNVPVTELGTIINEGDGINIQNEFCLDENNSFSIQTNILLGNLDVYGSGEDQYGIIPWYYPEMFIEYTINGVVYEPIPMGNFDLVTLPNGYPAFSYIAQSPTVDFSDECEGTVEFVSGSGASFYVTIKYRLVTPNGEAWDTYPACDYSQPGDLFSCYVYSAAPWCGATAQGSDFGAPDEPLPVCDDNWFSGTFAGLAHCDCEVDDGPPRQDHSAEGEGEYLIENEEDIVNRYVGEVEVKAYPNPVNDVLQIETNFESIKAIEVFNAQGERVILKRYETGTVNSIRLDMSNLPHGIYVMSVFTDNENKLVKVLK
ncbi:MAG: T9SS type A sorting domain-containing protein [Saprospiraceae bacterium]|nr:T9SS type A sorting domain-containing protein [Saprospiraceae bacterium]